MKTSPKTSRFSSHHRRGLLVALSVAGLAIAGTAVADHPGHHGPESCGSEEFAKQMDKRHTEHMAKLYAALKVTPAQETAWKQYANASQFPKLPPKPAADPASKPATDTPSLMEQRAALHNAMGERLQAQVKATRALYDQLTPEQRKVFDDFHAPKSRRGEHEPRRDQDGPKPPKAETNK